jgi:hypothetical protein
MTVKKHKNQSNFVEVKTNGGAASAFDLGTHGTNPMQSQSNPILDVGGKGAADSNGPKIEDSSSAIRQKELDEEAMIRGLDADMDDLHGRMASTRR